jgi:hypothetical protein
VCRQPAVPRAHSASLSRVKRMRFGCALLVSQVIHCHDGDGFIGLGAPPLTRSSVAAQSYQISTLVTTPPSARSYLHSCCLSATGSTQVQSEASVRRCAAWLALIASFFCFFASGLPVFTHATVCRMLAIWQMQGIAGCRYRSLPWALYCPFKALQASLLLV